MFFLIPKNVTSETDCADANVDSLGSLEGTGSGKVTAKISRQVGRDRQGNGRAQRTSVESIDGNGEIYGRAKAEDQGTVALVLDLAKASFPVVL